MHEYTDQKLREKGVAPGNLMTGLMIGAVLGYVINHEPTQRKIKSILHALQDVTGSFSTKAQDTFESAKDSLDSTVDKADDFFKDTKNDFKKDLK